MSISAGVLVSSVKLCCCYASVQIGSVDVMFSSVLNSRELWENVKWLFECQTSSVAAVDERVNSSTDGRPDSKKTADTIAGLSSVSGPRELWGNHHVWMASKPPAPLKICNWSWIVTNNLLPGEDFSPPRLMQRHFDKCRQGCASHMSHLARRPLSHNTQALQSRRLLSGGSAVWVPGQDNTCCFFLFYFRFH